MKDFLLRCRAVWQRVPCRVVLAATVAGLVGVAAGRSIIGPVYMVSGSSMWPTFKQGAMVHTTSAPGQLERGEVVVLDDGSGDWALKRIVGLPGETVYLFRGYVFINRRILLEPYVPRCVYTFPRQRASVFVLGQDQYFVLGDNRPSSADSRIYGAVERKAVKKRVLTPCAARARFGPVILYPYGQTISPGNVPKLGGPDSIQNIGPARENNPPPKRFS